MTPESVGKLIRGSGNNFHAKVARWFADNNWHVVVSPYYMDQAQNKPREIDLVVEKQWPIGNRLSDATDYVVVRLFVECKFISTESVFWFSNKNFAAARALVEKGGLFRPNSSFSAKHHYIAESPRVAKLFATHNINTAENEPFYKALNQSLNAMVSMRRKPVTISNMVERQEQPRHLLEFPVIVCSSFDRLFSVDFDSESEPMPIAENFQLEVQYAYTDRQSIERDEYFLLDLVSFEGLASFITAIDRDAQNAARSASIGHC